MRIGILTYHRAENYGALLQAYALMTYLQNLGHEVSFVDYWPKYHSDYFKLFPWQQIRYYHHIWKIVFVIKLFLWAIPRYVRKQRLQSFMRNKLGLPKTPVYNEKSYRTGKYDLVIYGSDQIWRKQHLGGVDFDLWYFGSDNIQTDKRIVYAGSMGIIETSVQDDVYLRKMMNNFDSVSVREKDLKLHLEKLGMHSSLVIDPVFLLSKEQWRGVCKKNRNNGRYILFYNLLNTRESMVFAEELSRAEGLPIKEINKKMSFHNVGKRYHYSASVEEFLGLIDGAEYVVSNSFHGVAMSLIFEKQFYAVGMGKKANRVISLLNNIGVSERYANKEMASRDMINYRDINQKLKKIIEESEKYLCCSVK